MRKVKGMTSAITRPVLAFAIVGVAFLAYAQAKKPAAFYCKYCGRKAPSVVSLTSTPCVRHPAGQGKGRHALYEGKEKEQYLCKHCGRKANSIATLTASKCIRHPDGPSKGNHEPAL